MPLSLQTNGLNFWYSEFRQFDLLEFNVWNIKGPQDLWIRKLEFVGSV